MATQILKDEIHVKIETSGGNDLVDAVEIPSEDVTTIAINKVLSFEEDKILFVSSSSWGSTSIEIMATRKGTIK